MAPVESVILSEMAVPCARLTFHVADVPVAAVEMVVKAAAVTWPAGMAALNHQFLCAVKLSGIGILILT